ncbi:hypothetical protein [Nostoc sp. FACHB-110]|uniref:hypothetical protein n=1 Tax=Nostoc sp. FACHB-110 TaxID=2692834 RepID=UPI00168866E4|nr:hypothetical protein [Nostoc sp. FACHB-110]MBD2439651.1 hypothetical protein [Nostoc sp. FACHB-110]
MRLFIGAMVVSFSFGLSSSFVQAQQPANNQVAAMVEALRLAAPQTGKKDDGLYSEWQVQPGTVKAWSKFCLKKELSPTQFENNPATARQIISCITSRELNKQLQATKNNEIAAVTGVACWWMTGNYTGCNNGFTGTYVRKVVNFYQEQRSQTSKN